jgi:hypothetical protein
MNMAVFAMPPDQIGGGRLRFMGLGYRWTSHFGYVAFICESIRGCGLQHFDTASFWCCHTDR